MADAPRGYQRIPGTPDPQAGRETPVAPGILARLRWLATGKLPGDPGDAAFNGAWFGPEQPLRNIAPKQDVAGRAFDYPFGINLNYGPRAEPGQGGLSFEVLRRFADPAQGGLDLVRLLIETRKDQMAAQTVQVRARGTGDTPPKSGGPAAMEAEQFLQKPDGVHTFRQWLRMLLEDHFVIDAPAIYFGVTPLRPTPALELIDGATLKLLIDDDGRTPQPPVEAYQQILKGVPATSYTTEEIGYYPFNLRTNRLYGMSRVEQILGIVTIALNRQLSVLDYFTAGTIPDGLVNLPPDISSPGQVKKFQKYWDALMTGQLDLRRKMRFLPSGATVTWSKDQLLKDAFDEWLARICCFCFSIPPQAFVKETNRATAETAKEAAQEEGLEPVKLWVKDVLDDVLARWGHPELEAYWKDEEITDPQVKSVVCLNLFGGTTGQASPIITLAEAREMMGYPPASKEQMAELAPAPAPSPFPPNGNGADHGSNGNGNGNGKPIVALTPGEVNKMLGKGVHRPRGLLPPGRP